MPHEITPVEFEFLKESALIEGYDFDKRPLNREIKTVKANGEKAFIFMMDKMKETKGVLYEPDMLKCHGLLMKDLLPHTYAGAYRDSQVYVGSHTPPKAGVVPLHMQKFIEEYNSRNYEEIFMHAEFETIHPFKDGNGRLGRILWACDLVRHGHDVRPMLDGFCRRWYMGDNPVRLDEFSECKYNYYEYLSNHSSRK